MKSGLTPLFDDSDLDRWFDKFQDQAEEKIFKHLSAGGEKFIEVARKSGSYHDQTGNLRSSIGYIIAIDGETVSENFEKADKGSDGNSGVNHGRQIAQEISLAYPHGYILIGVAGMHYAVIVEARGRDVITSGNIQCEDWLRKSLNSVFSKM